MGFYIYVHYNPSLARIKKLSVAQSRKIRIAISFVHFYINGRARVHVRTSSRVAARMINLRSKSALRALLFQQLHAQHQRNHNKFN
jgi:hypothetical protein